VEYVNLFVVLGQGCASGFSIAIGLGRFPPHLQCDFGHTLDNAPAQRTHFAAKVRNRPLGNVLGQITAPLQLRQDQQYADQMPKDRGGHILLVQLSPDQQLDLGGQVIHHLIPINHAKPSGGVIAQQRFGRSCQGVRNQGEELGHPDVYELKLRWSSLHIPSRLPAQITKSSRVVRVKFTFGLFVVHPRRQEWRVLSSQSGELAFPTQPNVDHGPELPVQDHESTVTDLLNEAPTSKFHRRTVIISGVGFFTDAYDLFVIGTAAALVAVQWHLSTLQTSWVTGAAILGAFVGAFTFGRIADVIGRKKVYVTVAVIMIFGAIASALAPDFIFLVIARLVLGLGIGGDYPVSAVLMSEYSNRQDRGRLVGLVFSMQALGLIVGPLIALILLSSGIGHDLIWRILLGLGAIPAAAVIYLRSKMPESPRYLAQVQGESVLAAQDLQRYSEGVITESTKTHTSVERLRLREFLADPRMLRLLLGTAGAWFLFDYAYYGNTLSLPAILKDVNPAASLETKLLWSLGMFVIFAVPGYLLAVTKMDRIGHRKLQFIGFSVMAVCFLVLASVPALTQYVAPFLAILGLSYFFIQFGPNMTTFVLPSEVFPVSMRTTGHGVAAGIGKLGAFVGVFLVPVLQDHIGLRGLLAVAGVSALLGIAVTTLLPEPAGRTLEDVSAGNVDVALAGAALVAPAPAPTDPQLETA